MRMLNRFRSRRAIVDLKIIIYWDFIKMLPFAGSKIMFKRLPADEDCESLMKGSSAEESTTPPQINPEISRLSQLCTCVVFLASFIFTLLLGIWIGRLVDVDKFCIEHTSNYCKSQHRTSSATALTISQHRYSKMSQYSTPVMNSTVLSCTRMYSGKLDHPL